MEIKSTGRVESAQVRRIAKSTTSRDDAFKISDASEQPRANSIAAPGPLAAVETILTLQNIEDSTDGRSKGTAHGELLDRVRDDLLAGGIPRVTLNRLASAVTRRHDNFSDPRLLGRAGRDRACGRAWSWPSSSRPPDLPFNHRN